MPFAKDNVAGYKINGKNVCPLCVKDSALSDVDKTLHLHLIKREDIQSAKEPVCCDRCKKPL